jgi:hypothetical protein
MADDACPIFWKFLVYAMANQARTVAMIVASNNPSAFRVSNRPPMRFPMGAPQNLSHAHAILPWSFLRPMHVRPCPFPYLSQKG